MGWLCRSCRCLDAPRKGVIRRSWKWECLKLKRRIKDPSHSFCNLHEDAKMWED